MKRIALVVYLTAACSALCQTSYPYVISTVAGRYPSGDGGLGTAALSLRRLGLPPDAPATFHTGCSSFARASAFSLAVGHASGSTWPGVGAARADRAEGQPQQSPQAIKHASRARRVLIPIGLGIATAGAWSWARSSRTEYVVVYHPLGSYGIDVKVVDETRRRLGQLFVGVGALVVSVGLLL